MPAVETVLDSMSPEAMALYQAVLAGLKQIGAVKVEPKKTSIHLLNRHGFAGVHPRKGYLNIEIHLARRLSSPRIVKVEQASVNRYHHTIRLDTAKQFNAELLGWLREAYELKA